MTSPLEQPESTTQVEPRGETRRRGRREQEPQSVGSFLAEIPLLVLVALAIAVLIKTFLVQAFYIPSGSMIPTLEVNDRIMVNKLVYRFGEPDNGDIVVFESPYAPELVDESLLDAGVRHVAEALGIRMASVADDFIKRVIAVEGETIEVRDNQVLVDGVAVSEPYLAPDTQMPDFGPQTIPDGHVFVMGDNRNHSQDGRVFGPIPVETIVGKAFVRLWPAERWGGL